MSDASCEVHRRRTDRDDQALETKKHQMAFHWKRADTIKLTAVRLPAGHRYRKRLMRSVNDVRLECIQIVRVLNSSPGFRQSAGIYTAHVSLDVA